METTEEEKLVLLALEQSEPASLANLAKYTGLRAEQIKAILPGLVTKGLIAEPVLELESRDGIGSDDRTNAKDL